MRALAALAVALGSSLLATLASANSEHLVVGSKAFPESWILAESAARLAQSTGAKAEHSKNLGGTEITYAALASGQIDLYPEYTGTLAEVILHDPRVKTLDALREALAPRGLSVSDPLGFNDGYALAASAAAAKRYGLRSLSDLARWPDLHVGLTHELPRTDRRLSGAFGALWVALLGHSRPPARACPGSRGPRRPRRGRRLYDRRAD